jgi:deazaflavin-dependent oxidoreductase (nitroreductase family)
MADSRDMLVIHQMFRREFNAIPGLVSAVPEGDSGRVAIVADHVQWMVTFLHTHHEGEDLLVWPKLLERGPVEIDALVHTMEAQHAGLALALDDLGAQATEWRKTSAVQERTAVARAANDLLPRVAEHLDLEERKMLSLIDMYLTDKEWKQIGGHGLKAMSFGQLKVAFGTILYETTPEQVQIMRDTIPRGPWLLFSFVGPRAYAKYAKRLNSASTAPPDSSESKLPPTNPNDAVIAEFRANSGSVTHSMGGALADIELVLLHHPGRLSGKAYITPLAYMDYEDDYLLLGSFAGASTEPKWVENVESAKELTVEVGARTRTMTPTVLRDGPQRDLLYEAAREHWSFVADYEQQTSRAFPVVRLTAVH